MEAQRIHRAQKSGRFPYLTKPYTYDKVVLSLLLATFFSTPGLSNHINTLQVFQKRRSFANGNVCYVVEAELYQMLEIK